MSAGRAARGLATVLLVASALSGCGGTASPGSAGLGDSTRVTSCTPAAPGTEHLHGPVAWEDWNTGVWGNTWLASQGAWDHGMIQLDARQPVILCSVTVLLGNPKLFAPVTVLGAWVSPAVDNVALRMVRAGKWGEPKKPVRNYLLRPVRYASLEPILVVRLRPTVGKAAKGRKWAADSAVVLHYQTLDGQHYEAPFAYLNVWPTSSHNGTIRGGDLLVNG